MKLTNHFSEAKAKELSKELDFGQTWDERLNLLIKSAYGVYKINVVTVEKQTNKNKLLKATLKKETINKNDDRQRERFEGAIRQIEGTKEADRQNRLVKLKLAQAASRAAGRSLTEKGIKEEFIKLAEFLGVAPPAQLEASVKSKTLPSPGKNR